MNDFREYSDYLMHYSPKKNKRGRGNGQSTEKVDFVTAVTNNVYQLADKAQAAGDKLLEMVNRGDYIGAYNYYKSLDAETKRVIERRIINHELPAIIGKGNERDGRRVLNQFNNNIETFLSTFTPKTETTTRIVVNDDAKQITGRRRRR